MAPGVTPYVWVAITFPILVLLNRWIHRHIRGVALLLTGNETLALALYAIVLFPGVLLHEISHWLSAGLMGVRTGGFSVWPRQQPDGSVRLGYVEYYRDKTLGPIRESLIGAAPLIFGTAAIVLIGRFIFDLPKITNLVQTGSVDYVIDAIGLFINTADFLIWFYLLFAISNAMLPSPSDRKAWPAAIVITIIVLGLLLLLDLGPAMVDGLLGPGARLFSYLGVAFTLTIFIDVIVIIIISLFEVIVGRAKGQTIEYY